MGTPVIGLGYCPEALLTGCVPHLDLHFLAVDIHRAHGEVHSDGVLLLLVELPRLEAVHHARLPHVGVPDQDDLEEVIESVVRAGAGERHPAARASATCAAHLPASKKTK